MKFRLLTSCAAIILLLNFPLSAQPENWRGSIEWKKGITYVHNPQQGLWGSRIPQKLRADRVFSIGSLEAAEEYLFSWVQDIATDSAGNIYACDSRENRIQVYRKDGKYLRTIGRRGKGRRERRQHMKIALAGNRLYVLDSGNYRISIFETTGEFLRSISYEGFAGDLAVDAEERIYLQLLPVGRKKRFEPEPIVTVYDSNGHIAAQYGEPIVLMEKGAYGMPYYSHNTFALRPDGTLLSAFNYPYRILFFQGGVLKKTVDRRAKYFTEPELVKVPFKPLRGKPTRIEAVKLRSYIWDIFPLKNGMFLTFIRDAGPNFRTSTNEREFDTYIDLFDDQGRFLISYAWDWRQNGLLKHVDHEGNFYSNFGETPIVPGVTVLKVDLFPAQKR